MTVPPSMRSPLMVTPTSSPVIVPELATRSLIRPDSVNKFSIAACPIFVKSIFANLASSSSTVI